MTLLIVSIVAVILSSYADAVVPVNVTVMYETLCPDSVRFITEQLAPAFNDLGSQRVSVDFIPFGKASARRYSKPEGTEYEFLCQHGDEECRGNKLHACALHRLSSKSKQVKFVSCSMGLSNPAQSEEKCADAVNLSPRELQRCADGSEGDELLYSMFEKSYSNMPFVPRISFNGRYSISNQSNALSRLQSVICDILEPTERPSSCKR